MKTYDLYHEDDHNNELYANVSYESDTGDWVPAEVAQGLYDALVRFINASESPNEEIEGQLHLSTRIAQRALSIADGDNA